MTHTKERSLTSTHQHRATLRAMYAGLVLTVVATIAPYVDRATSNMLARHIRDGYPAYTQAPVDSAATAWLVILSVIGTLGVASWIWTIWAVKTGRRWATWAATTMFALGTCIALTALLVKDTSGDTGLPPLLGWIGMMPCLAGFAAVTTLWRRR
jgi:cytochrome bd-type quinol oxidase subunit 2